MNLKVLTVILLSFPAFAMAGDIFKSEKIYETSELDISNLPAKYQDKYNTANLPGDPRCDGLSFSDCNRLLNPRNEDSILKKYAKSFESKVKHIDKDNVYAFNNYSKKDKVVNIKRIQDKTNNDLSKANSSGKVRLIESTDEREESAKDLSVSKETKSLIDEAVLFTPDEVRAIRQAGVENQKALYTGILGKAEYPVYKLNLSYKEKMKVIRVPTGSVSILTFFDSTGKTWPVEKVAPYEEDLYNVKRAASHPHMVSIQTRKSAGEAIISLYLKDEPMPVTIKVETQVDVFYPRVIFTISKNGPNAEKKSTENIVSGVDPQLDSALSDLHIEGARIVPFKNDDSGRNTLWVVGDEYMILRTTLSLRSPDYTSISYGGDGYKAYKLPVWSPLVLSDQYGRKVILNADLYSN